MLTLGMAMNVTETFGNFEVTKKIRTNLDEIFNFPNVDQAKVLDS